MEENEMISFDVFKKKVVEELEQRVEAGKYFWKV